MIENDQTPSEVLDEMPETGDLSTQEGGDVMETAYKAPLSIVDVKIDKMTSKEDKKKLLMIRLVVRFEIGPEGVDGEGKMAKRRVTGRILTWFDETRYTSDWWKKKARFDYKSFLKCLDYDPSNPPKINDAYLAELKGLRLVGDIIKQAKQQKNADGKYVPIEGEFENVVKNFRKAK